VDAIKEEQIKTPPISRSEVKDAVTLLAGQQQEDSTASDETKMFTEDEDTVIRDSEGGVRDS